MIGCFFVDLKENTTMERHQKENYEDMVAMKALGIRLLGYTAYLILHA